MAQWWMSDEKNKYKATSLPDTKYIHFTRLALVLMKVPTTFGRGGGGDGSFSFTNM